MNDKYIKINFKLWKLLKLEAVKKDTTIKELSSGYIAKGLKRTKKVKKLFKEST